jgi:soluble lytic murein transglycosylase-like protein
MILLKKKIVKVKFVLLLVLFLLIPFRLYNEDLFSNSLSFELIRLCEQYNIDLVKVLSIIEIESNWRNVISDSGKDIGLMQIRLNTAKEYDKNITINKLLISTENIKIGIQHLKYLEEYYNGNGVKSVVSYNLGQKRVNNSNLSNLINNNYYLKYIKAYRRLNGKIKSRTANGIIK